MIDDSGLYVSLHTWCGLFTNYDVQDNDMLASLSTQFNVSQEELKQYNHGIDWNGELKFQEDIVFVPFTGANCHLTPLLFLVSFILLMKGCETEPNDD